MEFSFQPIGVIHSCFKEKFGIPRQPGLLTEARASIELLPPYDREEALRGLEDFSHIWLVFVFHQTQREQWRPTVRPPRLGGNKRLGVFATRSTHRPNPIGLSVVELEGIDKQDGKLILRLKGIDLVDGTPVLDIKPYLPYSDHIANAKGGFAPEPPASAQSVEFTPEADAACRRKEQAGVPNLRNLIVQLLSYDPRPAYYDENSARREFGMKLYDFDLKWTVDGRRVMVVALEEVGEGGVER